MVAWLVRPALRPLPGQVACMAASYCFRMTWRFTPSWLVTPKLCVRAPRTSRSRTCRAMRRLVVRGGDLSVTQPSGQGLGVLPVRVLTKICMPSLRRNSR
jgi:hypothetical protein